MNWFEKIQDWFKECSELKEDYIFFNVIPSDVDSASITTQSNDGVINEFMDGSKEIELRFNLNLIMDYDRNATDVNLKAMGLFSKIDEWVESKNKKKEFPDFGKNVVNLIEPAYTNADVFVNEDETKCQYQAQYKIDFIKRN